MLLVVTIFLRQLMRRFSIISHGVQTPQRDAFFTLRQVVIDKNDYRSVRTLRFLIYFSLGLVF